jgi:hypothetical protein
MNFNRFTIAATSTGPIEQVTDNCLKIPASIPNYKQDALPVDIFFTNSKKFDFIRKFVRAGFEGLYEGRISVKDGRIGLIAQMIEPVKWAPRDEAPKAKPIEDVSFDDDSTPF